MSITNANQIRLFKIENGIPIPLRLRSKLCAEILQSMKETIVLMNVGQSFLFDNVSDNTVCVFMKKELPGIRFTLRIVDKKSRVCRMWITGFDPF